MGANLTVDKLLVRDDFTSLIYEGMIALYFEGGRVIMKIGDIVVIRGSGVFAGFKGKIVEVDTVCGTYKVELVMDGWYHESEITEAKL